VDLALREAGHTPPARHQGGLATWAAITAGARAALACDSAHGHLAAALGVPTTVLFHASVPERFRRAWTPSGPARALALSASELDSLSLAEALP
jgi:ADP-heptose:LPS heptosyltransferase